MEPTISVGILSAPKIEFNFKGAYSFNGETFSGNQSAELADGKIIFNGEAFDEIIFSSKKNDASFDLIDVVIGIGFHWERKENQRFQGGLRLIIENDKLTAINIVSVENYLTSVISSEMSATSSLELLKAHAVISRSWLLAQLKTKNKKPELKFQSAPFPPKKEKVEPELIKWYDKDDHINFDVCADDHCQRYQGITRASTEFVRQAIEATKGEVLMHKKEICDARFSKCCGGIAELFENCWQPEHYDYLLPVEDKPNGGIKEKIMTEAEVEAFIKTPPAGDFCNTTDAKVLSQVLNSYDQETPDFYRWKVSYSQEEITELIARRSGIDFGDIIDLIPIERGISGRLIKLKIVGSKHTLTIGKELEIRKWLSNSHLYSSAFIIEKTNIQNELPQEFTLLGAGWGHGVGLCQIGAAVMAENGYLYKDILLHYFRNTDVEKIY